jgi:hypothetical protein
VTFLVLYVDDILVIGNDIGMLNDVKSYLNKKNSMKDLGEAAKSPNKVRRHAPYWLDKPKALI